MYTKILKISQKTSKNIMQSDPTAKLLESLGVELTILCLSGVFNKMFEKPALRASPV